MKKMIIKKGEKIFTSLLFFFASILMFQLREAQLIPTYYIDPEVLRIFQPRIDSCLHSSLGVDYNSEHQIKALLDKELQQLPSISASDYFRGHEVIAHSYFTKMDNPHRRSQYEDAEFEYIPLLPLSWRVAEFSSLSLKKDKSLCTYSRLIQDIVSCATYIEQRNKKKAANSTSLPRFTVASTYNMRTQMGMGMPTQVSLHLSLYLFMRYGPANHPTVRS